jgi:hypothetical protein
MREVAELKDAICDLRYLLERGYKRKAAVTYVSNKYRLNSEHRNFLLRAVYPRREAEEHRGKLAGAEEIQGREVVIDGYNVLITVENALRKNPLILCDDGFVRDTSATYGKHKISEHTFLALDKIMEFLREASRVTFIFDSQVSHSGELCRIVREKLQEHGLRGDAVTSSRADRALKKGGKIISTSDTAIIKEASKVIDIPSYVAQNSKIIKLPSCEDIYLLKGS